MVFCFSSCFDRFGPLKITATHMYSNTCTPSSADHCNFCFTSYCSLCLYQVLRSNHCNMQQGASVVRVALSADDHAGAVSRQWELLRSAFMRRDTCLLFHLKVSHEQGGDSLIRHRLLLCQISLPRSLPRSLLLLLLLSCLRLFVWPSSLFIESIPSFLF